MTIDEVTFNHLYKMAKRSTKTVTTASIVLDEFFSDYRGLECEDPVKAFQERLSSLCTRKKEK